MDRFSLVLEWLRCLVFISFCVFSARIVFVCLAFQPFQASLLYGTAGAFLFFFAWLRTQWALFGFVALLPAVSGFQVTGVMNGLPVFSYLFACIFLAWFAKWVIREDKNIVPRTATGNLLDILSAIVLLSMMMLLAVYPMDMAFRRFWLWPFAGQNQALYGIDGSYVLLQGLFFYRLVEMECTEDGFRNWLLPVFYLQAACITGFSLVQWVFGIPALQWGRYGIKSPFNDIHSYGSYVLVLFFLFAALSFSSERASARARLHAIWAGVLFVFLIWSGGNGTFLAMLCAGMVFLAVTVKKRHFLLIASLTGVLLLSVILSPALITKSDYPVVRRYQRALDIRNIPNVLVNRFILWDRAVSIIAEYPLTGSGAGTFYRISPRYHDREVKRWKARENWRENAHNYYLQLAAELGIPALLIFLLAIAYAFRGGGVFLRQAGPGGPLVTGLLFGLGAYLLTMLTSHPLLLSSQQFLFWFTVAAISVASAMDSHARKTEEKYP